MTVEFAKGSELNRATMSYDYSPFSNYALLWFSPKKVAMVKLNYSPSPETTNFQMSGKDKSGKRWRINCSPYRIGAGGFYTPPSSGSGGYTPPPPERRSDEDDPQKNKLLLWLGLAGGGVSALGCCLCGAVILSSS